MGAVAFRCGETHYRVTARLTWKRRRIYRLEGDGYIRDVFESHFDEFDLRLADGMSMDIEIDPVNPARIVGVSNVEMPAMESRT